MSLYRSTIILIFWGLALVASSCNQRPTKEKKTKEKAAPATGHQLSVKDMQADLSILWSAIKELHPGYGLYSPTDSMAKSYTAAFSSLNRPMYENEFIDRLHPFLCTLGCGHTQLRHSANYKAPAGMPVPHLPFEVLVHQHRAWVTATKTAQLATGDEIISINNEPAAAIIQSGYSLYGGDGHVESFKELYLSEYGGFEDACNLNYHWTAPYHVAVRTGNGTLKTVVLDSAEVMPAGNPAPQVDKYASWTKNKSDGDIALYFSKQGNTALFEVKGLEYADTVAYAAYFDQVAKHQSKNLILDLRHNGGGDLRITIKLLSYLADAPFGMIKDLRSRLQDPSHNSLAAYFDPERTESFRGSCLPAQQEGSWYHMDVLPAFCRPYGPIPIAGSGRFKGNLFVLVDGATFSSAALLTAALKAQRKNLVFVGRETAGTEEGCNGFAMQELTLPHTGVTVEFPWLRVVSMAVPRVAGRGLMPDYQVNYTPEDVVSGYDRDLATTMQLIAEK